MMIRSDAVNKFDKIISGMPENCSDLHITSGKCCFCRTDGILTPLPSAASFSSDELQCLLKYILTEKQQSLFAENNSLDISYSCSGRRLRISVYRQNRELALAVRVISTGLRSIDNEEYPAILKRLILKSSGLILITGPSGSGKSSTLAAMLSYRAELHPCHIITLEDPVEYLFTSQKSLIHQREYGNDFLSFEDALKSAMRQDPDIIFIGEIRDRQTMQAAFSAAQTGHLVISTLHTSSVAESLLRIEGLFGKQQRDSVRLELSIILQSIITQRLLPRKTGGRICAMEILTGTDAVRSLIAAGQPQQIMSAVQTGRKDGMQTMETAVSELRKKNLID